MRQDRSREFSARTRLVALAGAFAAGVALVAMIGFASSALGGRSSTVIVERAVGKSGCHQAGSSSACDSSQAWVNGNSLEIQRGVADAMDHSIVVASRKFHGKMAGAVLVSGIASPLIVGVDGSQQVRMWSLSKPVAAVTALRLAAASSAKASGHLETAIEDAITKSSNCGQRRVALGIQSLAAGGKGTPAQVGAAWSQYRETLALGGVDVSQGAKIEQGHSSDCTDYLGKHPLPGVTSSTNAAYFGTQTWSIGDAAKWAESLGAGKFGAEGTHVLGVMRDKKEFDDTSDSVAVQGNPPNRDYTVNDPAWGAGTSLSRFDPAWKSGWGSSAEAGLPFELTQMVVIKLQGRSIGLAVRFVPNKSPIDDDPGKTTGPQAIESVMAAVGKALSPYTGTARPGNVKPAHVSG